MSSLFLTSPKPCNIFANINNNNGRTYNNNNNNSYINSLLNCSKNSLVSASIAAALSFTLQLPSPLSIAADSPPFRQPSSSSSSSSSVEDCREDELVAQLGLSAPNMVTNEGIVEEAWEIVNDSFLYTGRDRWSPESWLV